MKPLESEAAFFKDIAEKVLTLVAELRDHPVISEDKGAGDYATDIDVKVEELIVGEIEKRFPRDAILAEEAHAEVVIPDGRIWIIDPICGTLNLGKGINSYCSNIALADKHVLVAACVVDHAFENYIWSIGNQQVCINDQPAPAIDPRLGVKIDVDFGSYRYATKDQQQSHRKLVDQILADTIYDVTSLNTSLGLAYNAIGKMDGFIHSYNHPWDVCAGAFLIQQAGGVVSALDGSPWTITTNGAIGARTPALHQQLVTMFNAA